MEKVIEYNFGIFSVLSECLVSPVQIQFFFPNCNKTIVFILRNIPAGKLPKQNIFYSI